MTHIQAKNGGERGVNVHMGTQCTRSIGIAPAFVEQIPLQFSHGVCTEAIADGLGS